MSGKNCKLCGVSDESFGCYETCTTNGPQHEWSTFEDLRRELAGLRSHTSTIPDIHTQAEAMRDALVTARARLEQIGRYDFASPQTIRVIDAALGITSSPPTIDRAEADRRYAFSKKFPCSDGAELIKHGCGCRYVYQGVNVTTQQCATHANDNLDTHAGGKK